MAKPKSLPYEAGEDVAPYSVTLHNTVGGADKIYKLAIEPEGDLWSVKYANGRRGGTLTPGLKTKAPVAYADARKTCNDELYGKVAKGYVPIEGSRFGEGMTAEAIATIARESSGMVPQLLLQIEDEATLERLLTDDAYAMEVKYDGERRLIEVKGSTATGGNRKGQTVALDRAISEHSLMFGDVVLDGEQIGQIVHVWDILKIGDRDLKDKSVRERKAMLDLMCANASVTPSGPIAKVETAYGTEAKRAMLAKARADNEEGVVLKRLDARYEPGKPGSKATWLKFKFWNSLSAIVGSVNDKRSVTMVLLLDGGAPITVGNVTIPANHAIPIEGSVIEVRYLYAYEGGSLFQPTYLGPRADISQEECLASQRSFKRAVNGAAEAAE